MKTFTKNQKKHKKPPSVRKYKTELCDDDMTFEDCELAILRHTVDESEALLGKKIANGEEVNKMIMIKAKFRGDDVKIHEECVNDCNFLFTYYTDIYNKVRKDEIDIHIMNKLLDVLKQIEDGKLDQHEGAFLTGTILKELYVDSAIKKADKLNANDEPRPEPKKAEKNVTYKQFKKMRLNMYLQ